ncbi:hypothetical protein [Streptomyces sp. NPDC047453]|uniref:hypothetical protein n=1 Tax=Streptomyces sp. NPDC047453 TaxID=3154812 RepID=UPI0033CB3F29
MVFHVFAAVAEFIRALIVQGTYKSLGSGALAAAPLVVLHGGPPQPVWRPVQGPGSTVSWSQSQSL